MVLIHSGFPLLCEGGNWIFELNEIQGELKFFKIKLGEKKSGGGRGIFEIFIWGKLLEIKIQEKTKFQNEFKNAFMSYIIDYLSNSSF